jgi:acetyl-CoA acetyltransferase
MSNLVSDSSELITPAHDRFLDGHPTRRELQKAFNKMGNNDAELFAMIDTQALVGNFLCEKLGVTREELDAYVEKKAAEVKALQEAQKPQETANEQPNG